MLLWSLDETARQLGGVSIRTVRRMVERGDISFIHVGRLVRIIPDSVHLFVAGQSKQAHNSNCVGSLAWKGDDPCYTNAETHHTGTRTTSMQPAKELDALLEQLTKRRRKR